jgi:hypothetical protein
VLWLLANPHFPKAVQGHQGAALDLIHLLLRVPSWMRH